MKTCSITFDFSSACSCFSIIHEAGHWHKHFISFILILYFPNEQPEIEMINVGRQYFSSFQPFAFDHFGMDLKEVYESHNRSHLNYRHRPSGVLSWLDIKLRQQYRRNRPAECIYSVSLRYTFICSNIILESMIKMSVSRLNCVLLFLRFIPWVFACNGSILDRHLHWHSG